MVDPMRDIDGYVSYADRHGLKITHVFETHIHADFASGAVALAEETGAELALSAYDTGEHYQYAMEHRRLCEGDRVEVGTARLRVLHSPGHTPEHLSYIVYDLQRSEDEPVALLSGDFLFVGSLGRPDLLGEEAKLGLAEELFKSLHERIAALPDSVEVYPGHGAGSFCGAGMSEQAESTLGYERATNPLFQMAKDAFITEILGSVPAMPCYYPRMKALNAVGACSLPRIPGGTALSVNEVMELARQDDVCVLDVRRPEAFGGAHVPGAINLGAGQNLSLWAGWLLDAGKRIVLIGDAGDDESSRRGLVRVGLDRIEGYLSGGMAAWIDAGYEFARTTQLSATEVHRSDTEALIVDVRSEKEWLGGHIAGATHIPLEDLRERFDSTRSGQHVVLVCGSGYRSSLAASLLAAHHSVEASSMHGGMAAWNRQGFPLSTSID